jgi:hypothetical protein
MEQGAGSWPFRGAGKAGGETVTGHLESRFSMESPRRWGAWQTSEGPTAAGIPGARHGGCGMKRVGPPKRRHVEDFKAGDAVRRGGVGALQEADDAVILLAVQEVEERTCLRGGASEHVWYKYCEIPAPCDTCPSPSELPLHFCLCNGRARWGACVGGMLEVYNIGILGRPGHLVSAACSLFLPLC